MNDADSALAAELGLEPPSMPPSVIDAEIVPPGALPARRSRKKVGAYPLTAPEIRKRDRVYTDVALLKDKKYVYGRLSDRERKLVTLVIKGMAIKKAAEEIGVSESTAHRYIRRPFVRAYIEQMRQRAAGAADLTPEKVARVLNAAVDGTEDVTAQQITAASVAARLLTPAPNAKGTSITVNQQNNYGVGVSPFAGVDSKAMLDTLSKNLLEMRPPDDDAPPASPAPDAA